MQITIEEDLCTNCQLCVDLCSDVFCSDGEDSIQVSSFDETDEIVDACYEAAEMCPTNAIIIY